LRQGCGIAWVENARGLLLHLVHLDAGRISQYRIVAPTEWNFHPAGALQSALIGSPASDLTSIKKRAAQVVHSLDPCVTCRVEFDDA
jgi:Ni,Fe-hydrogenase I large subunit